MRPVPLHFSTEHLAHTYLTRLSECTSPTEHNQPFSMRLGIVNKVQSASGCQTAMRLLARGVLPSTPSVTNAS